MSNISLHGLGFIQVQLEGEYRLHVWDKDLPRRKNLLTGIHNHRWGFVSHVLKGMITNHPLQVKQDDAGEFIAYDHPPTSRGEHGNRGWVKRDGLYKLWQNVHGPRTYVAGEQYVMHPYDYHRTETDFAVTMIRKLHTSDEPSTTLQLKGHAPDPDFDRFQLSEKQLWAIVTTALAV